MRKIKEVLRLYFEQKQSIRQISRSCNICRSTIQINLSPVSRYRPVGIEKDSLKSLASIYFC